MGEPLILTCLFENLSDDIVNFLPMLVTDFNFIGFKINCERDDGTVYNFMPGVVPELNPHAAITPISLPPGGVCSHFINPIAGIVKNKEKGTLDFIMRTPGIYQITAVYNNPLNFTKASVWSGKLISNTITICIGEPQGKDADAFTIWDTEDLREFFGCYNTACGPKQIDIFKTIIEKHPQSVYAPYAKYYLADCYFHINPRNFARALEEYRAALTILPEDSSLRKQCLYAIGVCLYETGNLNEAKIVFHNFLEEQKISSLFTYKAKEMLTKIKK